MSFDPLPAPVGNGNAQPVHPGAIRTGAIILARLDSTRLPGKQLRLFSGRPLLQWLLDRVPAAAGPCILATTARSVDDPLAAFAASAGISCFRGDLEDAAGRILQAAEAHDLTHFFRLNGDSPAVLPELLESAISLVEKDPALDLVTNLRPRSYPYGIACELFRTASFRAAYPAMCTEALYLEHVSSYFYEYLSSFQHAALTLSGAPQDHVRLTVDTEEDARFFEALFRRAGARWTSWTLEEITDAAAEIRATDSAPP